MSVTGAIIVYALLWFLIFLVYLPRGQTTQAETGHVEPGTPPGAPSEEAVARKALWTTLFASIALAVIFLVIEFRVVTLDDFDILYPESYQRLKDAHQ